MQQLIDLFSQPPASFVWSSSEDGQRTMGTSEGFVLDIWQGSVEAAALFPHDRPDLVERNATLLQLLLMAMRPDWNSAPSWLAQAMRMAARHAPTPERPFYDEYNVTRRVRFQQDAAHSRATMRIDR
jgi:hypothetical protein